MLASAVRACEPTPHSRPLNATQHLHLHMLGRQAQAKQLTFQGRFRRGCGKRRSSGPATKAIAQVVKL